MRKIPSTYASGREFSAHELMTCGERIINVEKAFNTLQAGFTRKDDYPPDRFFNEPVSSGPLQGEVLHWEAWNAMLDQYYTLHGWDKVSGLPTKEAFEQVDLPDVYENLLCDPQTRQLLSFTGQ